MIQSHETILDNLDNSNNFGGSKSAKRKSLGRMSKIIDIKNVIEVLFGDGGTLNLFPETAEEREDWRIHLEDVTTKLYSKRSKKKKKNVEHLCNKQKKKSFWNTFI